MNLLVDHPVLQTGIVGSVVGAVASAITLYLWHQDRSERYLLYWSIAWACSSLRWAFHYTAATDAAADTRDVLTPRPTMTPHKKITTAATVAVMNMKTSCLPFS